ncbi:hypothetical protein, partial [Methylobacterium aquaticum]|jgi:hypothetical protein|uniref:hypothetical protein n=1 Tax=Methylobacterium aquaticum TaxID=270351 RepID=UPI0018CF0382
MAEEQKKRGRPPKPAAERRRHNQTFRCTDDMLAKLQAAADEGQRSLSEEVERRLETSFREPEIVNKVTEMAMNSIIDTTMNNVVADCGGQDGYESGRLFGRAVANRLEKTKNTFEGATEPWYRDAQQINFLLTELNGVKESVIESLAQQKRRRNPTDTELLLQIIEIAKNLGIKTEGLGEREIVMKISEFYQSRSGSSPEDWPNDEPPMQQKHG